VQLDRAERAGIEAQRLAGRREARGDKAAGDHDVAAPQAKPAAREVVREPRERLERMAHDVAAMAFAELLARIRALMRRGVAESPRLCVGDLMIELLSRRVTRGGAPVELTAREFDLLAYLMRYEHQVVSRETLARDVWRETARSTPLDNVIDVHIARLRRKVDVDPTVKMIHTVRGVGYMLCEGEP